MLLYHGSNVAVEEPEIKTNIRGLDFGDGFYLTSDIEQAKKFSVTVRDRAIKLRAEQVGSPTASVYEYDEHNAQKNLIVRTSAKPDDEWLDFVKANRQKSYNGKFYDVVIGPVANDAVFASIRLFEQGILSIETVISELRTWVYKDQYCMKSSQALQYLSFCKAYDVPYDVGGNICG